jgi:hypothetical protein
MSTVTISSQTHAHLHAHIALEVRFTAHHRRFTETCLNCYVIFGLNVRVLTTLWDVTMCNVIEVYQRFEGM